MRLLTYVESIGRRISLPALHCLHRTRKELPRPRFQLQNLVCRNLLQDRRQGSSIRPVKEELPPEAFRFILVFIFLQVRPFVSRDVGEAGRRIVRVVAWDIATS